MKYTLPLILCAPLLLPNCSCDRSEKAKIQRSRYDYFDQEAKEIAQEERDRINAWLKKNNLNAYGDSENMMYTGGDPNFDENSGKNRFPSSYHYVIAHHSDRPWNKENVANKEIEPLSAIEPMYTGGSKDFDESTGRRKGEPIKPIKVY